MAALLVALSVMSLMMSVVMPVWKQATQRDKEVELIFRGEQYKHAIGLFQRKNGPGTLPPNLDVLVEQRFIRRKYRDPIANDDFQPLFAGQAVSGAPSPGAGAAASSPNATPAAVSTPGRVAAPASGPPLSGTPTGGVIGVMSKSKARSIRVYNGRSHYNEWAFVFTAPATAPGTTPTAARPGVAPPGRGSSGPGSARGAARGNGVPTSSTAPR
jgi:type II secretory pathway pseudopilin PulG